MSNLAQNMLIETFANEDTLALTSLFYLYDNRLSFI